MKPRHLILIQQLLLFLVVIIVYSPAFHAEPCLLDDVAMLKGLQGDAQLDLKTLLVPNTSNFSYYRPVIGVSYWLAQTLWHANPQAMHIENVAFHLLNVILIFWLIRFSLPDEAKSNRYIPFLGALLFAVHPIATESVNWISGRTDLIAGSCLISATVAVLAWQRKRSNWWFLLFALALLTGAIMTKEVAWGFLIVIPFFLASPYDSRTHTLNLFFGKFSTIEKLLIAAGIALCFFLASLFLSFWPVIALSIIFGLFVLYRKPRSQPLPKKLFVLMPVSIICSFALLPYFAGLAKQHAAGGYYSTFSRTVLLITLNIDNSIAMFSAALAFYIKKFFLPLPLSFAIDDIASGYLFAGIAVIILTGFLAAWRSQAAVLFLTGIALVLPALPLAHAEIAWAPYAERYIYIPSGFWIASLAVGLSNIKRPSLRTSCVVFCLLLIAASTFVSYNRSKVWQSNVTLFEDTSRQSPKHNNAQLLYMIVLGQAGRLSESLEKYRSIQKDSGKRMRIKYANDLALLLYNAGQKREAFEVLQTALTKPLPMGQKHPLPSEEWQKLYKFHSSLKQENNI